MCFLYRQSISIVYESKFKYIYRYFIKIDRCFCGILQSLPLRKCGLKFVSVIVQVIKEMSLPLRKCGLKLIQVGLVRYNLCHFPCGSVDWNHMVCELLVNKSVTSLAEVWIEISMSLHPPPSIAVTSLAEVWIEIWMPHLLLFSCMSLPLRKCGLKFRPYFFALKCTKSLPLRKCGLKFRPYFFALKCTKSLPLRKCGLKFGNCWHEWCGYKSLPLRKCGLKLPCLTSLCSFFLSLPLRKCGLKYI